MKTFEIAEPFITFDLTLVLTDEDQRSLHRPLGLNAQEIYAEHVMSYMERIAQALTAIEDLPGQFFIRQRVRD